MMQYSKETIGCVADIITGIIVMSLIVIGYFVVRWLIGV